VGLQRLRAACYLAVLAQWGLLVAFCPDARPQASSQQMAAAQLAPLPGVPSAPQAAPPTVEQLAERLRALEETNSKLARQRESSSKKQLDEIKQLLEESGDLSKRFDPARPTNGSNESNGSTGSGDSSSSSSSSSSARTTAPTPVPAYFDLDTTSSNRFPLKATFGPGFQLATEDDRFSLQIHYESQIEGRVWEQTNVIPANSGIYLPRQRIFFNGDITPLVEYEFAINRGLGGINVLNAFINFHFDDEFEVRIGRFFTPVLYEQYAVSNYWLLTPERSLFATNLGLNRQFGIMPWGYLFDKQVDYAFGVFNGSRNSFENLSGGIECCSYLNARPFQECDALSFAKFLNIGGSVGFGHQDQPPSPASLRIGAGSPDTNTPGPATVPFLTSNPGVVEQGGRVVGSAHTAYFFKGLSLLAECDFGFGDYASLAHPSEVRLPFSGYYAAAGYFLTGEEVEQRTRVKPLKPLVPVNKDDPRGFGAWEAVARVSEIHMSDKVFSSGFADPSIWSNSATTTEVGMNWYWNEYLKFYLFWLHGEFGNPVQFQPNEYKQTTDMFWLRAQLYF
jgi:phosphate-selective porin OprO and OprP